MSASINRVTLLGQISKYGMEVRYNASGTPCASFTLIVAGQLVLFDGKLRKKQKGEGQWELIVSGFEVQPMVLGSMVTEAAV